MEAQLHILILGGTGFVGLNIAAACLAAGHSVTLLDRQPPPSAFAPSVATFVCADVQDTEAIQATVAADVDAVVLGAAITAGREREAADPESILAVNLGALPGILRACRKGNVRRVINLSSAAAYGQAPATDGLLREDTPAQPESLYAITKFASEQVGRRLAGHWGLDFLSVRLSAVFGRWERSTGVRDTLSPQAQILAAALTGSPAVLPRAGERDWIYATDVAEAVRALVACDERAWRAVTTVSPVYNVTSPRRWSALAWGQALARHVPGFVCRLAEPAEAATIDLHAPADRPSLAPDLLRSVTGWSARFGLEQSVQDLAPWAMAQRAAS